MKLTMALIGAALLTLILSPTLAGQERRAAVLRLLFYRDFPETPYDFAPKSHAYHGGVRIA